jgi:hypothetical protein
MEASRIPAQSPQILNIAGVTQLPGHFELGLNF